MTKIYTKNTWTDEVLADTEKYQVKNDSGAIVYDEAEITLSTPVVTAGTPVTAEKMNNIEEGVDDLDDLLDAVNTLVNTTGVSKLRETSGPDTVTAGDIPDETILVRDGSEIIGKTIAEMQVLLNPYALIGGVLHKQLWIAGFKPTKTAGCADPAQIEMSTNKTVYDYLAFDKDTIEYAYANVPLPQDYAGGVIYGQPYWTHPATTTNFKVSFGLSGVAIGDAGAMDVAQGTPQYSNDTGGTTSYLYVGPLTSAITISGTPAAGKLVQFRASRKADDATNDTLNVDAYLLGWLIWYPVR